MKRSLGVYYSILTITFAMWTAACDYGATEPTPPTNYPPVAEGPLPWDMLTPGDRSRNDLSTVFRDPDGETLDYLAHSRDPGVVLARTEGSTLTLLAVAQGVAEVTVSATDAGNLSASLNVVVTVMPGDNPPAQASTDGAGVASADEGADGFHIEIVPVNQGADQFLPVLREAASRWMSILNDTELPNITFAHAGIINCHGLQTREHVTGVDDLMVLVSVGPMDGEGGARGGASVCLVRDGSYLPIVGTIRLDQADLFAMHDEDVMDAVLHDLGHNLGIGLLWDMTGLLRSPTTNPSSSDEHFTGVNAVALFDASGGTDYSGAKVPAEPGAPLHWRESVFGTELMTPVQNARITDPISAITIQSLNDMGYSADAGAADSYRLPSASGATAHGRSAEGTGAIESVETGPIQVVDGTGGVVAVIGG